MKRGLFLYVFSVLSIVCSFILQSCTNNLHDNKSATIKVALREAGNQLLLKQHDSTSLILPVIQDKFNRFRLSFQSQLSLEPNMLVKSVDSSFTAVGLSQNYRVEVLQCSNTEVAYSYEMNMNEERTLIPCSGRILPKSCYTIEVTFFDEKQKNYNLVWYILILMIPVILLGAYMRKRNRDKVVYEEESNSFAKIGSFQFYPEQNKLVKAATEISLSKKECELLEIFVANLNQVVKRDELTKKVWEDNGVIVGRSLDTYISKLRKKLKDDERIQITNVHGVGYKLEIQ